jgi:hypothetical protein
LNYLAEIKHMEAQTPAEIVALQDDMAALSQSGNQKRAFPRALPGSDSKQ